jgi:hypothetical protein
MASSNSPYLGAAILQGIGGGAKTYAGLRNQESEMALRESEMLKNTMGLLNERFDPLRNGNFRDMWTGKEVGPEERAAVGMKMGLPENFFGGSTQGQSQGLGAVPKTVSTVPSATPSVEPAKNPPQAGLAVKTGEVTAPAEGLGAAPAVEAKAPITSASDLPQPKPLPEVKPTENVKSPALTPTEEEAIYSRIDQTPTVQKFKQNVTASENKINELNSKLAKLQVSLESAPSKFVPSIQAEASDINSQINSEKVLLGQNLDQYNKLRDRLAQPEIAGLTRTREKTAELAPSIVAAGAEKIRTEEQAKNNVEVEKNGAKFIQDYPVNNQNVATLINAYQKFDMNRLTVPKADIIGIAKDIPGLASLLKNKFNIDINAGGFQGAADTATKASIMQAIGMLSKTTDAQLNAGIEAVADPSRDAGAKYTILVETKAKLDQQKDAYDDFIHRPDKSVSWPVFSTDWQKAQGHSLEDYEKSAAAKTPYFAGMTEADAEALKDTIKRPNDVFDEERKKGLPAFLKGRELQKGKGPDGRDLIKDKETGTIYDGRTGLIIGGGSQ